jgi:hydroxymethylbilane synthase
MRLRLATRGSPLARWQAEHVGELIRTARAGGGGDDPDPDDVDVEIVVVSTEGDRRRDVPLSELGG